MIDKKKLILMYQTHSNKVVEIKKIIIEKNYSDALILKIRFWSCNSRLRYFSYDKRKDNCMYPCWLEGAFLGL